MKKFSHKIIVIFSAFLIAISSVLDPYCHLLSIRAFAKSSIFQNELVNKSINTISDLTDTLMDSVVLPNLIGYSTIDNLYKKFTGNPLTDNLFTWDSNQSKFVMRKYNTEGSESATWSKPSSHSTSSHNNVIIRNTEPATVNNNTTYSTSIVNVNNDNSVRIYNPISNTYETYYDVQYSIDNSQTNEYYVTFVYEDVSNYYITNVTEYGVSISYTPKEYSGSSILWSSYCIYYILPNSNSTSAYYTREQLDNVVWTGTVYNSSIELPDDVMAYWSFDGTKDSLSNSSTSYVFDYSSTNYTNGYFGSALQLNGVNTATIKSYVNGVYTPLPDEYTLEAWVFQANPNGGGTVANGWHHMCKTRDSNDHIRIFIDGKEGHVGTISSPRFSPDSLVFSFDGGSTSTEAYINSNYDVDRFNYEHFAYSYPNVPPLINKYGSELSYCFPTNKTDMPFTFKYNNITYAIGRLIKHATSDNLYFSTRYKPTITLSPFSIPQVYYLCSSSDVEHYYPTLGDDIVFGFTNSNQAYAVSNDTAFSGALVVGADEVSYTSVVLADSSIDSTLHRDSGGYWVNKPVGFSSHSINGFSSGAYAKDIPYADLSNYLMDELILTSGLKYTDEFTPVLSPLTTHKIVPSSSDDLKLGDLCIASDFGYNADTVLVGGSLPFSGVDNTVYIPLDNDGFAQTPGLYNNGWVTTQVLVYDGEKWVDSSSFNFVNLTFKSSSDDNAQGITNNITYVFNFGDQSIVNKYDIDIDDITNTVYNSYQTTKDTADNIPDIFTNLLTFFNSIGFLPSVVLSLLAVLFAVILVIIAVKVLKILFII